MVMVMDYRFLRMQLVISNNDEISRIKDSGL